MNDNRTRPSTLALATVPTKRWSTIPEAAEYFGCSERLIERLVAARVISSIRVGRLVRIDLEAAEAEFVANGLPD